MKRIFFTGASGCIGHYIAESLIYETDYELFLLVRNPAKLQFNYLARPNVNILVGDLREIEQFSGVLKTINVAILAATSWGGTTESIEVNVVKTLTLLKLLDSQLCQQVIYFSTASILDRNNKPLKEAGEIGTNYIRTKYACYTQLHELAISSKITTLFPTLVFGGDQDKPYSHLSSGLPDVIKWIDLARWFKADGSFHFIHAQDIAQVVRYLVERPLPDSVRKDLVLGNSAISVDQTVEKICAYLNKSIYFRIPLSMTLANFFIQVFRLKMQEWDRFCLDYRHFTYKKTVTPATFKLTNYCSTIEDVLQLSGILPKTRN